MAERLSGAKHVGDATAVDDLDRADPHHEEEVQRCGVGLDDHRARREVLHFDGLGEEVEVVVVEAVIW